MSKTGEPPVPYEEAKKRALAGMDEISAFAHPSSIADIIWPKHFMSRQAAAVNASIILNRMQAEGLVHYRHGVFCGWVKTRPSPR